MIPANVQTEWARLLIGSIVQAGIEDLVLSPGSRSTPLVVAALGHPKLRCSTVIDERCASFFALGQVRTSGRPSALLCTSGTAGAHYFPAVLEAEAAGLPLLVITADRPPELQHCGAPQTIDQRDLYGRHVAAAFDVPLPDASEPALRALWRLCNQAVAATQWPRRGVVHLNVPARKPLEPVAASTPTEQAIIQQVDRLLIRSPIARGRPHTSPSAAELGTVRQAIRQAKRGLVVAGPGATLQGDSLRAAREFSRLTGYPLIADVASQWGAKTGVPSCLDTLFAEAETFELSPPDLVIQLGRPPTSAAFAQWLNHHKTGLFYVLAEEGWPDPSSQIDGLVRAPIESSLSALCAQLGKSAGASDEDEAQRLDEAKNYSEAIHSACLRLEAAREQVLSTAVGKASEARAVRALLSTVPASATLVLGNSLAIRLADLWSPTLPDEVHVLSQRGVNGIDGLVSGAVGAAVASKRPTALLVGDVSLLHDLNALALPQLQQLEQPLVLCVLNNRGGRIFDHLPLGEHPRIGDAFRTAWTTPHRLDLAAVAKALGMESYALSEGSDPLPALRAAWQRRGATLLEVRVPVDASVAVEKLLAGHLRALPTASRTKQSLEQTATPETQRSGVGTQQPFDASTGGQG